MIHQGIIDEPSRNHQEIPQGILSTLAGCLLVPFTFYILHPHKITYSVCSPSRNPKPRKFYSNSIHHLCFCLYIFIGHRYPLACKKCAKCLEGLIIGWILARVAPTRPEHILESMWALSKWCLTFLVSFSKIQGEISHFSKLA